MINLTSLVSYAKDFFTSVFATDTPGAPQVGDTDFMPASAALLAINDLFNLSNGQIPIGKDAGAAITNPSTAPVLTNTTTGGSLVPGAYQVGYTYLNFQGETLISSLGNITIPAGTSTNKINVAAITPLPAGGITSVNWYLSKAVGGFSLGYASNNAGAAFSLTALPLVGAVSPPGTNTTASAAHPVKSTLTAGNGIAITTGPGSISIAALGIARSGTAFPGTPSTNDLFIRTDEANTLYFFTGTSWAAIAGGGAGGTSSGTSFPSSPLAGQLFVRTDTTPVSLYRYNGSSWDLVGDGNTGTVITSGTSFPGSPTTGQLFVKTNTTPVSLNRYNGATWDTLGDGGGTLTSAHIFVGNGSNVPTDVAMSGDGTMANTGALTVTKVNGKAFSSAAPAAGNVPTWNATTSQYEPTAPSGGGGGTNATAIQGVNVSTTGPANKQGLVYNSGTAQYEPGSVSNATLIQNQAVSATIPLGNQLLRFNSGAGQWQPSNENTVTFVGARVDKNVATTASNTTFTKISFNVEVINTNSIHSNSTLPTRLTVPIGMGGVYLFMANVRAGSQVGGGNGSKEIFIKLNNTTDIASAQTPNNDPGDNWYLSTSCIYNMSSGDYVELVVWQNTGGTVDFGTAGGFSNLTMYKIA